MSRWIETICVVDGVLLHLADHQERMDRTLEELCGIPNKIRIEDVLQVPSGFQSGRVKCRVVYHEEIVDISWQTYRIKPLSSIGLVRADHMDYSWKYEDRKEFDRLRELAGTDDIIVVKDGLITDSSYANLIFRQNGNWFTPSTPLLPGTQRHRLIEYGQIQVREIKPQDLETYEAFKYINAMLDIEFSPTLSMRLIRKERV